MRLKKRYISILFALLMTIGVLTGCAANDGADKNNNETQTEQAEKTNEQTESAFPITLKDATDKEVTIKEKPEKIVSIMPSNTEIAFALGIGDEIVGVSDNDNYPKEVADKEKVGGMELNIEKIISLKPDLILAHESGMGSFDAGLNQLRDAGITVLVVNDATNFEETYESIGMIAKATGTKEEAEKIISDMKDKIKVIEEKAASIKDVKKVFMEISPEPEIYAAGKNTFMDEILQIINAKNAVTEEGWPKMDQEAIISTNPDVILTTYGDYTDDPIGHVLSRKGWEEVNAIKNKQVVDVNPDLVSRPGPRLVEGVEEVAKAVYPDVFSE